MNLRSLRLAVAGMGLPEPPMDFAHAGSPPYGTSASQSKEHNSLRNYLDGPLQDVDGGRVFTVHGLRKLGFNSKESLEQHFSTYGKVTEVFVTRVSSKSTTPDAPPRKIRAGNFGIVVMDLPESVNDILADANLQMVQNVPIRVDAFVAQRENNESVSAQECSLQPPFKFDVGHDDQFQRQAPSQSTPSSTFRDEFHFQGKPQRQISESTTASDFSEDLAGKFQRQVSANSTYSSTRSTAASTFSDDVHNEEIHKVVTRLMPAGETFPTVQDVDDSYWSPKKVPLQMDKRSAEEMVLGFKCHIAQNMISEAGQLCAEAQRLRNEAECIRLHCVLQTEQRACNAMTAVANLLTSEALLLASQAEANYDASYRPPPLPPACWLPNATQQNLYPPGLLDPKCVPLESKYNGTLSDHLVEVSEADPSCVFVVRQIHKFGFQSCDLLRRHFSHYGKVLRVLVADKRVKCFAGCAGERKTRPGGMGLIIMEDAGSVSRIMSAGCEQLVFGNSIVVQPYDGPKTGTCVIQQMSL